MSEEVPDARRGLGLNPDGAPATTAAPTNHHQAMAAAGKALIPWSDAEEPELFEWHPCDECPTPGQPCACSGQPWPSEAVQAAVLAGTQALRDKVADLEVYAAELHEALEAIAAHFADEVAFPGSPLGKVRDALAVQPPQHRQQLQDRVERLERENEELKAALVEFVPLHPEKFRSATTLDQGEAQGGEP